MSLDTPRFSINNHEEYSEYFHEHGFVIISDCLPVSKINDFHREYNLLLHNTLVKAKIAQGFDITNPLFASEAIKALENVNHSWVADVYDTSAMIPSFLQIIAEQNTLEIANQLLNTEGPLYPFTNRIRIDPPSDDRRTYGWHQEIFYTIPKSNFVQTWCPLIYDVRVENGTISVADGSHKEGIPYQTWTEYEGRATQIIIPDEIVDKYPTIPVEMNVGEMLFFSGNLAHKSGNNVGDRVRFSLVGMYHDTANSSFVAPGINYAHKHQDAKQYFDQEMAKIKN